MERGSRDSGSSSPAISISMGLSISPSSLDGLAGRARSDTMLVSGSVGSREPLPTTEGRVPKPMKVSEILNPRCVRVPLVGSDKTEAITELVDVLHEAGCLSQRDQVLKAVLAREETRSTGIGHGLAVPHGKSTGCSALTMAIGKPTSPLEFGSIDGRPCNLIVLLASPVDETGPHIQALASVSRLWQNDEFRKAVLGAEAADALLAAIVTHES